MTENSRAGAEEKKIIKDKRTESHFVVIFGFPECLLAFFFPIWVFFHDHSQITGLQEKGEGISLTPHYCLHPLHRHLNIIWAITAENSPLYIGSSKTRTGNLWFPSASH